MNWHYPSLLIFSAVPSHLYAVFILPTHCGFHRSACQCFSLHAFFRWKSIWWSWYMLCYSVITICLGFYKWDFPDHRVKIFVFDPNQSCLYYYLWSKSVEIQGCRWFATMPPRSVWSVSRSLVGLPWWYSTSKETMTSRYYCWSNWMWFVYVLLIHVFSLFIAIEIFVFTLYILLS